MNIYCLKFSYDIKYIKKWSGKVHNVCEYVCVCLCAHTHMHMHV